MRAIGANCESGTEELLQALSSRATPKPLRLERGSLEPENVYGQEKLCTKNPTHDCRCGQIKARTKDCAKGSNRCGDYCRHCRRRRSGHEVNGRPERPDAENRGERAVWKKQNEDGQDRAKEKTLSTKASKFERPPTPALFHAVALIDLPRELRTRDNMRVSFETQLEAQIGCTRGIRRRGMAPTIMQPI
jgi:hypothetical protein